MKAEIIGELLFVIAIASAAWALEALFFSFLIALFLTGLSAISTLLFVYLIRTHDPSDEMFQRKESTA